MRRPNPNREKPPKAPKPEKVAIHLSLTKDVIELIESHRQGSISDEIDQAVRAFYGARAA